jgi:hypothetical protein
MPTMLTVSLFEDAFGEPLSLNPWDVWGGWFILLMLR